MRRVTIAVVVVAQISGMALFLRWPRRCTSDAVVHTLPCRLLPRYRPGVLTTEWGNPGVEKIPFTSCLFFSLIWLFCRGSFWPLRGYYTWKGDTWLRVLFPPPHNPPGLHLDWVPASDVLAPAWPESPGFGLALDGFGLRKSWAGPKAKSRAWLGLALAQAGAFRIYLTISHFLTMKSM